MAARFSRIPVTREQAALADEVKKVHQWLRRRTQEVGAEQAWREHLQREDVLQQYAQSMKQLATHHWDQNHQGDRESLSRISWIVKEIESYFKSGGYQVHSDKESMRFNAPPFPILEKEQLLKLLDVGSCYNPFKQVQWLQTFAIDLCPATDDVKKCNILDTTVGEDDNNWWCSDEIKKLPPTWFNIVTFSLFLEYLPSPKHRQAACKTAWDVLKPGGLLLIVTPDSKHSSANARLMKTWKFALLKIGFVRITLEKLPYLYCMTFRKSLCAPKYLECLIEDASDAVLSIPQDTVDYLPRQPTVQSFTIKSHGVRQDFLELPFENPFDDA